MNVLFFINDVFEGESGVNEKIKGQSLALKSLSQEYYFIHNEINNKGRLVNEKINVREFAPFGKYLLRYFFSGLKKYVETKSIDLVYIRYTHFSSPSFLLFLSFLKKNDVKIILEFPTFPYDTEYSGLGFISNIKLSVDKLFRVYLYRYVSLCITFTYLKNDIFNIKTLTISNALDKSKVFNRKLYIKEMTNLKSDRDTIVFTAVASMYFWHGYDRLINSFFSYVSGTPTGKKIIFNIVGDGPELKPLKKQVLELNLSKHVKFHGHLTGSKLDQILYNTDIGVDSLGRYRSGNKANNSLKSKEYLSFGLPILKSHMDDSIDGYGITYTAANDDSEIILKDVLKWYLKINASIDKKTIADICLNEFTWEKQMKVVIKEISNK